MTRSHNALTDFPTPIEALSWEPAEDLELRLVVFSDGFVASHPLPAGGAITVGRAPDCDIRIDVQSVSRHHLLLRIADQITVEDLGSANGTFLREERLVAGRPTPLAPGRILDLGTAMLALQAGYRGTRPRHIRIHDYFEARLEEECLRADGADRGFSLLRLRITGHDAPPPALHESLLAALRPGDVIGCYAPGEYEVLMPDLPPAETERVSRRLSDVLEASGAHVQSGIAHFPRDGRVPEALMSRASSALSADEGEDPEVSVVVESPVMRELHKFVARVAVGAINVLVLGETGVGKELIAESVHSLSPRADRPLLRLNCAALAENLLESELFGHERGAFTGAATTKPGLLEVANGGTVFLDEIGDMPLSIQAKLLRTLEEGCVRRVGGVEPRPVDIRIVAATHKDPEAEVARGRLRRDLYFRIAGVTVVVPPLRERIEDIPPLVRAFVWNACRRSRIYKSVTLSDEAREWLCDYDWPGNIRELRNVIDRAVLLCADGVIRREHLPSTHLGRAYRIGREQQTEEQTPLLMDRPVLAPLPPANIESTAEPEPIPLKSSLRERERQLVLDALTRSSGNQTQAAKLLGVSRGTLIARIKKFGLPRPRGRRKSERNT